MKRYSIVLLFFLLCENKIAAQQGNYQVVFDLTSRDSLDQKSVIRWLNEISKAHPDAKLEVVMYGKGLEMAVKDKSYVPADIEKLAANKNVSFKVCEIAMKNNNISSEQLLTGIGIVPDGIFEIISKQREGWGYIKAAR
jgi:intracellular sulfur oxidation DsrE/DsrF family protein